MKDHIVLDVAWMDRKLTIEYSNILRADADGVDCTDWLKEWREEVEDLMEYKVSLLTPEMINEFEKSIMGESEPWTHEEVMDERAAQLEEYKSMTEEDHDNNQGNMTEVPDYMMNHGLISPEEEAELDDYSDEDIDDIVDHLAW